MTTQVGNKYGNNSYYKNNNNNRKTFEIRIPRLILRNLNFKVKEDELKSKLQAYGSITDFKLPKKENGSLCGYGFISYSTKTEAINAMNTINSMKEKFLGTKVVVDWCLPKDVYLKNREQVSSNGNEETSKGKDVNAGAKSNGVKNSKPKSDDDEDEEDEAEEEESDDEDNEDKNDVSGDDDEEEDEDDDDDKDEDEDEEDDGKKNKKGNKKEDEKEISPELKEQLKKNAEEGTKDVQEKRTIFIRNLSYDTTQDQLREEFSKYGKIVYCKLCYDRDFERPKGTAFVQFATADEAMNACADSDILEMDSRKIQIDLAISRRQINDIIVEKKTKIPEDRRNITLAKEGSIDPNSSEGKALSKADLSRRLKIESINNAKLKLLHYFVSTTRLSVHNIPTKCTDSELKKIFLDKLSGDKNVKILECRIMHDAKRVNSDGVARSRGYGFVKFTRFDHARKALHAVNNNPDIFPDKKTRLIVQFSVENMKALQKKERRIVKEVHKKERFAGKQDYYTSKTKDKKKTNKKNDNEELDEDKKREKNLLRLNILEKKLNKRKMIENKKREDAENKKIKKQKREETKQEPVVAVANDKEKLRRKLKRKRNNKKALARNNTGDKVDHLVDKYLNEKNKVSKKRKWFD